MEYVGELRATTRRIATSLVSAAIDTGSVTISLVALMITTTNENVFHKAIIGICSVLRPFRPDKLPVTSKVHPFDYYGNEELTLPGCYFRPLESP
jgi:hypothetical protein